MANFYQLEGGPLHISFYPNGKGPIGPAGGGPILEYKNGTTSVTLQGTSLAIAKSGAGTVVTGLVAHGKLPGASTTAVIFFPDVELQTEKSVKVSSYAILAEHREVTIIGAGPLETYSEVKLHGTAQNVLLPL